MDDQGATARLAELSAGVQREQAGTELSLRMKKPQRHRLLQGYPALPLLRPASTSPYALNVRTTNGGLIDAQGHTDYLWAEHYDQRMSEDAFIDVDRDRPLLIGVIPHTQCTPRVEGCGFCTFPHDPPDKKERARVVASVGDDINEVVSFNEKDLKGRKVAALYFGGGTANLSSTSQIEDLFSRLARHFDLSRAEVTLEGIPVLFTSWLSAPLRMLAKLPVRHRRISMGIQTFERSQLERMGRTSFGDEALIKKVVQRAHDLGLTTSGDFLFNLPHQTPDQMLADVERAIDAGLDQVCLYNLVLYQGLGTLWSKDDGLIAAMRPMDEAAERWLALRDKLLTSGFVQTTVTNFERREVAATDRRFIYEEASFCPEKFDALGVGPLSVSTFLDFKKRRGVKLLRRKKLGALPWSGDDLFFPYEEDDLRLLFVTRSLARTKFQRSVYRDLFGADVADHFPHALSAAREAQLVEIDDAVVALTPRGMFFSDSVVGALASERSARIRGTAAGHRTLKVLDEPIDFSSGLYAGMG